MLPRGPGCHTALGGHSGPTPASQETSCSSSLPSSSAILSDVPDPGDTFRVSWVPGLWKMSLSGD